MSHTPLHDPASARRWRSFVGVDSHSPYLLSLLWGVWLPFAVPTVVQFLLSHPSLPVLLVSLGGLLLFLATYLRASWRRARQLASGEDSRSNVETWLSIVVLTGMSVVLVLVNGGEWLLFFYFIGGYIGSRFRLLQALPLIASLVLVIVDCGLLVQAGWPTVGRAAGTFCVIWVISFCIVRAVSSSWELHAIREEMARLAVTAERTRIARDLHDLLGHNLSLIALKSELARRLVTIAPERALAEISDVERVARTTLQEVRDAVASYRQPTLTNELESAGAILAAAGIAYHIEESDAGERALPVAIDAVLAWTVREGVTNCIRHSGAHHCSIRLHYGQHEVQIEIIDDGPGSSLRSQDLPPGIPGSHNVGGNGLRGLHERVAGLDGRFDAGPCADGGFRLAVTLPLASQHETEQEPVALLQYDEDTQKGRVQG